MCLLYYLIREITTCLTRQTRFSMGFLGSSPGELVSLCNLKLLQLICLANLLIINDIINIETKTFKD